MNPYDFDEFLCEMATLDYPDILLQADRRASGVEKASSGKKGCVQRRRMGSMSFVRQIEGFLYFLRNGQKPAGVPDDEFSKYLIVVRPLLEKGQLLPSVLTLFGESPQGN